tara:strand:- start:41689 stop:42024 length:336 start_codon:yes stop_codon:yes gene_type:complete
MSNAKSEFIEHTRGIKVLASNINHGDTDYYLKTEYTQEEYDSFLNALDFEYDSGYGGQELYGIIWCESGIWLSRGEYDGSEWWEINQYPEIDDKCRNLDREREREINKVLE